MFRDTEVRSAPKDAVAIVLIGLEVSCEVGEYGGGVEMEWDRDNFMP